MKREYCCLLVFFCLFVAMRLSAQKIVPKLTVPKGHKNAVRNCYFTPNDKYIISTDFDQVLCIWDADDGRQLYVLRDSASSFRKIEINQASSLIIALTDSGKLYRIDLTTLQSRVMHENVQDFSLHKKEQVLNYLDGSKNLFTYNTSQNVKKRVVTLPGYSLYTIYTLNKEEACVVDTKKGILILNLPTGKLVPMRPPGSGSLDLHDFHSEKEMLLCTESKATGEGITYYNIDARTRQVRSKFTVKGPYRSSKCMYTADPMIFMETGMTQDSEGVYLTSAPVLYSFKTGKIIREIGMDFIYDPRELNLNSSRKSFITNTGFLYYKRFDLLPYNEQTVMLKDVNETDISTFACANLSNKYAVFNNTMLFPVIYNGFGGYASGIKKYTDLKINFSTTGDHSRHGNRKISFLGADEIALNDSVYFSKKPYDEASNLYTSAIYYLEKNIPKDSLVIPFEYMAMPLKGSDKLFLNRGNIFYVVDVTGRRVSDSLVFPSHVKIRDIKRAGNVIHITREDSLANPSYASLAYDIASQKIRDTGYFGESDFIRPYEELQYAHRMHKGFNSLVIADYDYAKNTSFEYPYAHGGVDSVAILDSTGETISYQAIQQMPYLRFTTGLYTPESKEKDIAEKTAYRQIQQVRHWKDNIYIILTREDKLFLYSANQDSVFKMIECPSDKTSRFHLFQNDKVMISNETRNDVYIIDLLSGRVLAHLNGYLNPQVQQSAGLILLQDAAFGNFLVYNEKNYRFICTITAFSKLDFVVNTANGLFDGTDNAISNLYFLYNDKEDQTKPWKTIDLKQLKAKYFIPGLWDKLANGDTTDLPDVESIKTLSLSPEITTDTTYSFTKPYNITLTDKGGGIGAVRLVINGKEVIADARNNQPVNGKKLSVSVDLSRYREYFSEGQNSIQVFCSNADSSLTSRGVITSSTKSMEQARPSLFVISIGTSDYKGKDIDLQYSSKDATDIARALEAGAWDLFSADSTYTYLITSTATDSSLLPSKNNIERVFKQVSKKATAKDIIVLYLSGHGINAGGDFCYLTRDAYTANTSAYSFKEVLQAVTITSTEFTEYFKKITARKQLLIIDACASGKVVENLIAHRDIPYSTLKALDRLKDRTGTHVITGCAADAVSYEASRYGQGLLTYSLLEGMKGASLRENKFLDVIQWFQYARERVPQLADGLGGIQTPQIYSPAGNQSFDIALLNDERKKQIPLASEKPVFIKSIFQDEDRFADHLQLGRVLDDALTESSASRKTHFIFFPVDAFPGAYQVLGRYKKNGEEISASVKLFKTGSTVPINSFTCTASDTQLLATAILGKITELK